VTGPLTLQATADLVGRYRYVELDLFAKLGGRAPSCTEAGTVVYLSEASLAHGFRAALFETLLPVAAGLAGPGELTRSPGRPLDEALDALVAEGGDEELLDALLGVVYPAMAAAYGEHLAVTAGPADGPLRRVLRRVSSDLEAVAAEGQALCAGRGGSSRAQIVGGLLEAVPGPFGPLLRPS
jgi:hypothetical protein